MTGRKTWQNRITKIEIVRIDGNSCIAHTAIDSVQNGYKTVLQHECIGVQNAKRFEMTKGKLLEKGIIIVSANGGMRQEYKVQGSLLHFTAPKFS